MLEKIKYYICVLIDWKIFVLTKIRDRLGSRKKYVNLQKNWVDEYEKWKKANDRNIR